MKTTFDTLFHKEWNNIYVAHREGYNTSVSDFHKHDFYEINLIFSGNIKILLPHKSEQTTEHRMVLTAPDTPHFITCNPDTLYSRFYLLFSKELLRDFVTVWDSLKNVFGQNGNILILDSKQCEFCKKHILQIENEKNLLRQKLLVLYLLSYLCEISGNKTASHSTAPSYILDALSYIENHYSEKITAATLAESLFIGRTTLMTNFKKYTGCTLNSYIITTRLKHAVKLLEDGFSQQQIAELCGFSDASGFIRCFKQNFNTTPHQYLKNK